MGEVHLPQGQVAEKLPASSTHLMACVAAAQGNRVELFPKFGRAAQLAPALCHLRPDPGRHTPAPPVTQARVDLQRTADFLLRALPFTNPKALYRERYHAPGHGGLVTDRGQEVYGTCAIAIGNRIEADLPERGAHVGIAA